MAQPAITAVSALKYLRLVGIALAILAALGGAGSAQAQTVWSGPSYTFTKLPFADYTQPENQDQLSPNVALTRADSSGLYNILQESEFSTNSPLNTAWATIYNNPGESISASNWEALTFEDWRIAYGGMSSLATQITESDAVVHLISEDIYLDLRFTSWSMGSFSGGGFSYDRSTAAVIDDLLGDYNGNDIVDSADYTVWRDALTAGSTTLLNDPTPGTVDEGDFTYWRDHFGDTLAAGAAAAAAVPEPTALLLALLAALAVGKSARGGPAHSCQNPPGRP